MEELSTILNSSLLRMKETSTISTFVAVRNTSVVAAKVASNAYEWRFILPPYILIFMLSISGNCLVIATLASNRRMRTITNVYLLNLAISDFLLGVFCLPFTLVGQIYRRFLFGALLCKLIPFLQAVSVSVDVWTLVAISLERYFAICRPLKSRKWQTQCHAYKMIAMVWILSIMLNTPILIVSDLQPMRGNAFKCREVWTSLELERAFNLGLDAGLLLLPISIMSFAYSLIVTKLWRGMRHEIQHNFKWQRHLTSCKSNHLIPTTPIIKSNSAEICCKKWYTKKLQKDDSEQRLDVDNNSTQSYCMHTVDMEFRHVVRSTHIDKSIEAKRKVIRMLFVIILEFFVCWTPLHVINTVWRDLKSRACSKAAKLKKEQKRTGNRGVSTAPLTEAESRIISIVGADYSFGTDCPDAMPEEDIYLFYPDELYQYIGPKGVVSLQLLAYCSSCCNPITYCFMNRKFKQAFISLIKSSRIFGACFPEKSECKQATPPPVSSSQDATACVIRGSHTGRTDSDWGSEQMDRKSVSGVAIFHRGSLVSWTSKKQTSVALSTAESEYIAAALSSWMDWKGRIVFSSGSHSTALGSGVHPALPAPVVARPITQVIETGEEGSQFLYRITWARTGLSKSNGPTQPLYE